MRNAILIILTIGVALAFAGDCHVNCPPGYHGGCVKSGENCDCSCWKDAQEAKNGIISKLQRIEASSDIQRQARLALKNTDELPETTLTDRVTKKEFTISLKTF